MLKQKYEDYENTILPYVYNNKILAKIIFITILTKGSLLIEDLPGTGKTTLSMALAKIFGFSFNRIHGTSDLLPQDLIGGEYYNVNTKNIEVRKGPIFTELFLVDEINRMNPKTQSAFLQAMEEKKVSILGQDFELPKNFFVIATQNPIEYSGTFSLPEAQKDRFYAKISLGNPSREDQEKIILSNFYVNIKDSVNNLSQIIGKDDLEKLFNEIVNIKISAEIAKRLVTFFELIKENDKILYPISQRGISIFVLAGKANAFLSNRDFVEPKDFFEIIEYFINHRLDIEKNSSDILLNIFKEAFKRF